MTNMNAFGVFLFLLVSYVYSYDKNMTLETALLMTSGVYLDTSRSHSLSLENTVLVTASNFAYLNFLHNWKCWTDRLKLKFLVIAMDEKTHTYLNKRNIISYYWTGNISVTGEAAEFRDPQFNIITNRYCFIT